jgi:hypothetical protein
MLIDLFRLGHTGTQESLSMFEIASAVLALIGLIGVVIGFRRNIHDARRLDRRCRELIRSGTGAG